MGHRSITSNKEPKMEETPTGFVVTVDLRQSVIRFLRLLDRVHIRRSRPDPDNKLINNAMFRYEHFWLPILDSAADAASQYAPPWDVYYVWCLHILSGKSYRQYCEAKYGRVLPHTFHANDNDEDNAQQKARQEWESRYPDEEFQSTKETIDKNNRVESSLCKDICESESEQFNFYYQVALPHFRDSKFLENAVKRYSEFMTLRKDQPSVVLWPTHDIELVRRTHMLYPVIYEQDIKDFLGRVDDLEDFYTDKEGENHQASCVETTSRLWASTYGTNYQNAGMKSRGGQITDPLREATRVHLKQSEPEVVDLTLDDICIAELWSNDRKITVEVRRLGETSFSYQPVFKVTGLSGETLSTKNTPTHGKTEFNIRCHRGVELHTYGSTGRFCMQAESHLDTTFFDPRSLFGEGEPVSSKEQTIDIPRISFGDPKVSFKCKVDVTTAPKPYIFSLLREPFITGSIPDDLKPFIKIPSWEDVGLFDMDTFSSARHQVRIPGGHSNFNCNVVCCRDLDLGAVLLYENAVEPVVVAHTIKDDQLCEPSQVSPASQLTLDTVAGDHGMLIRNKFGDWGVCVVKYCPDRGEGFVRIVFEHLQRFGTYESTFGFEESPRFTLGPMTVEMQTGRFTLEPDCKEAAEYITLAFTIGSLYVFAQTRQAPLTNSGNMETSEVKGSRTLPPGSAASKVKSSGKRYDISGKRLSTRLASTMTLSSLKTRRKRRSILCTMLLACGLQTNMLVEEDLHRMAFHSEVSLLSDETKQEKSKSLNALDDSNWSTYKNEFPKSSRPQDTQNKSFVDETIMSPGHSEFLFRKSDYVYDPHFRLGHEHYNIHQVELPTESPRDSTQPKRKDYNENVKLLSSESFRERDAEDPPLYETVDLSHLAGIISEKLGQSLQERAVESALTSGPDAERSLPADYTGAQEGDDMPPTLAAVEFTGRESNEDLEPEVQDTHL